MASLKNLLQTVLGLLCRAFHCGHGDKLVLSDRASLSEAGCAVGDSPALFGGWGVGVDVTGRGR